MKDPQILSPMIAWLPTMLTVVVGILINSARLSDLRAHMDMRFDEVDRRFEQLRRVEKVLDARLEEH